MTKLVDSHTHTYIYTKRAAFTLIELLVVIAIIGLLSTIAVVSLGPAKVNARNTTRKANLAQISKALEAYNIDNGGYPNTGGLWRGATSHFGSYPDNGVGAWIPNFTSYMAQLPHDPNTNKTNPSSALGLCQVDPTYNCYIYRSDGVDYKLMTECLPEGGAVSASDPLYDTGGGRNFVYQVSTPGAAAW